MTTKNIEELREEQLPTWEDLLLDLRILALEVNTPTELQNNERK